MGLPSDTIGGGDPRQRVDGKPLAGLHRTGPSRCPSEVVFVQFAATFQSSTPGAHQSATTPVNAPASRSHSAPRGHSKQSYPCAAGEKVFGGQRVHAVAPSVVENSPAAHGTQVASEGER